VFQFFLSLSIFIIDSVSLAHASDRPEDVAASYALAMERAHEEDIPTFGYTPDEPEGGKPEGNGRRQPSVSRELRLANAVERASTSLGIPSSHVFIREQLLEKQEKFNTNLYHALNAAICHISDYLDLAQNDESLKWTREHTYCFQQPGIRYPIEGFTPRSIQEVEGGSLTVVMCANAQMYEITRQRLCLDLTCLWNILVFWKKSIFPNDTIQSYSAFSAHALKEQILHHLQMRRDNFDKMPIDTKTDMDHYPLAIIDMLEKITGALPVEIQHILTTKATSSSIKSKIKYDSQIITQKEGIFNKAYEGFLSKHRTVDIHFAALMHDPAKATTSQPFIRNFKKFYQEFQSYRFPTTVGKMGFCHLLNFEKLLPGLTLYPSWETPFEEEEKKDLLPPESQHALSSISMSSSMALSMASAAEVQIPSVGDHEEEPETVIYDEGYWKEEHRRHQERKKAAAASLVYASSPAKAAVDDYQGNLNAFLCDSIHTYNRMTTRQLREKLKEVRFQVTQNRSGNGSVHYISPTEDNPLFGTDENYAGAYFNVHLPHNDGDIIPHDYFRYIKSGFANVFGLRADS